MNTVESDDLVSTLEAIIENYSEEVVPIAASLIVHLSHYFTTKLGEDDPQDENDTVAVTCMETLSAISTLMQLLADKPEMLQQAEVGLVPLYHKVFQEEEMEFLADVS